MPTVSSAPAMAANRGYCDNAISDHQVVPQHACPHIDASAPLRSNLPEPLACLAVLLP